MCSLFVPSLRDAKKHHTSCETVSFTGSLLEDSWIHWIHDPETLASNHGIYYLEQSGIWRDCIAPTYFFCQWLPWGKLVILAQLCRFPSIWGVGSCEMVEPIILGKLYTSHYHKSQSWNSRVWGVRQPVHISPHFTTMGIIHDISWSNRPKSSKSHNLRIGGFLYMIRKRRFRVELSPPPRRMEDIKNEVPGLSGGERSGEGARDHIPKKRAIGSHLELRIELPKHMIMRNPVSDHIFLFDCTQ